MNLEKEMDIKLVNVDIIGSGYSLEKEEALKKHFENFDCPVFVSGQSTCAAGVDLFWTICVFVGISILQGQIYDWYKFVRDNISNTIKNSMGKGAFQGDVILISSDCELRIRVSNAAGFRAENIYYQNLFDEMKNLIMQEKSNGRAIKIIEAPCQIITENNSLSYRCVGAGNYSLWSVDYKDNQSMYPLLYDAINQCFVNLENYVDYNLKIDKFFDSSSLIE